MARIEYEEHVLSGNIWIVSMDDGFSKQRIFKDEDRAEAEAYYEYLKREERQDSIAQNQAELVSQNKKIIENQERLLKAQEQQRLQQQHNRIQYPRVIKQQYDPEYEEWLTFKKETDWKFRQWKENKEKEKRKIELEKKAEEEKKERIRKEEERLKQKEKDLIYFETSLREIQANKTKLNKYVGCFDGIYSSFSRLSEIIISDPSYYNDYASYSTTKVHGGEVFGGWRAKFIKKSLKCILKNVSDLRDFECFERKLHTLKDDFDKSAFQQEMKKAQDIQIAFNSFYGHIYVCVYTFHNDYTCIKEIYDGMQAEISAPMPSGFFAKIARKRRLNEITDRFNIISDFFKANESSYKDIEAVYNDFEKVMPYVGIQLKFYNKAGENKIGYETLW